MKKLSVHFLMLLSAISFVLMIPGFLLAQEESGTPEAIEKKLSNEEVKALSYRGVDSQIKGDYDQAISDLTKVLENTPPNTNPDAYFHRALAYEGKGNHAQAIVDYTKIIEIKPDDARVYSRRGNAYIIALPESPKEAIPDFDRAIEIDPNLSDAYNGRAIAYARIGKFDKAIADSSKAMVINPDDGFNYVSLAVINFYQKQYDKSWDNVHKAEALGTTPHSIFLDGLKKASGREK